MPTFHSVTPSTVMCDDIDAAMKMKKKLVSTTDNIRMIDRGSLSNIESCFQILRMVSGNLVPATR